MMFAQCGLHVAVGQTAPPVIIVQPQSETVAIGYNATLRVGISNRPPNTPSYPTVQWFENGQASQVTGPWATNDSAVLTTNVSDISYSITAPSATNSSGFYRMRLQ